jgi:competence protein ComGC
VTFYIILLLLIISIPIILFIKGFANNKYTANSNGFSQAGVMVNYSDKTLTINKRKFSVNQVTGIRMKNLESGRKGNSRAMRVTIELDDFDYPSHKIMFLTAGQGEQFMQRISTALRKAGGPSFT